MPLIKKLNIMIVCDAVTHQLGGAFISPLRFAELLKARGHKIILISASYPNTPKEDFYKGIKIYRFKSISLPKYKNLIRLGFPTKSDIEEIIKKEKIDLVHVMVPTPAAITAMKVARKNNIRVVSHSHTQPENIIMHLPKFMRWKLLNYLCYKALIAVYKKTDAHICPSKFAERSLKKYYSSLNTYVISNGVNLEKFKKINSSSFFKKFSIPKKNKFILYVGRLDPEKCVDVLIKSAKFILKNNKNFTIGIVGGGVLKKDLEKIITQLGVEKNVKLLGNISDEDLIEAYNHSDVFVLPSLAELEAIVVLEAMACGKPIIIANSSQSASVDFVNENGFLFEPGNSKDLADKILKILNNDKLRKKMGEKSLAISKEYDIDKSVDKLEKVYHSL